MSYHFRLHAIRHPDSSTTEQDRNNPDARRGSMARSNSLARRASTSGATSVVMRRGSITNETEWTRRHAMKVAAKNSEWAEYYLSTGATDTGIAGLLSIKGDSTRDAEFYFNMIPKAVVNQDMLYKELLAVYNAITLWGEKQGLLNKKHILLAVFHPDCAKLLTKAKVESTLAPSVMMILKEIGDVCRRCRLEYRVVDIDTEAVPANETAVYQLLRLDKPANKQKMQALIAQSSVEKGTRFIVKERMFPPLFVV